MSREAAVSCVDGRCRQTLTVLTQSFRALRSGVVLLISYVREKRISPPLCLITMEGTYWLWIEWLIMLISGLIEQTAEMTMNIPSNVKFIAVIKRLKTVEHFTLFVWFFFFLSRISRHDRNKRHMVQQLSELITGLFDVSSRINIRMNWTNEPLMLVWNWPWTHTQNCASSTLSFSVPHRVHPQMLLEISKSPNVHVQNSLIQNWCEFR